MKKSLYFAELAAAYDAELQDLLSDSEGKSALKKRLAEKRQELAAILPMIEFSPEMVVPVFHDAFVFRQKAAWLDALSREPDDDDFPGWDAMAPLLDIAGWAQPHVAAVLAEAAGEQFMVTAAVLEFIRQFDAGAASSARDRDDDADNTDADDDEAGDSDDSDLAEAGDDWLSQQGFDSLKG